ncbi:glycosyltransferase [Blastopirellula sp. J2-11]|uniref:glycosyltransferase n=1 Tax=Blastopirellula sp. J2-11 TaxID=2943192 RepID=UPI0021C9A04F|nr:glycosyltransferase [Blastopirellula sp. J2-11]UUO05496.1 glycosyltransferase [Blastopirellula sp. J2-11]
MRANIQNYLPGWYRYFAEALCRCFHSPKVRTWLLPLPHHQGAFKLPLKVLAAVEKATWDHPGTGFLPGEGDILVLPDAYWSQPDIWPAVASARKNGAFVVSLVHDLIPLTHPQFVKKGSLTVFLDYVRQFATHSDLIVTVSSTIRDTLVEELPKLFPGEDICTDIRASRNGAELGNVSGEVRQEIKDLFVDQDNAPYIMVSTFDPRKNHAYALDAFDQLWEASGDQKLCLIGGVTRLCKDVIQRIENHPLYQSKLFAIYDATDSELSYCYEKSRAAVFPSIVEGFGLPIAEAQWYGKHVFASDTPIHREVGGTECSYCALDDPGDLARQIAAWDAGIGKNPPPRRKSITPTTWRESSELLLKHCLDGYNDQQNRRVQSRIAA